jgi:hypothetical protein
LLGPCAHASTIRERCANPAPLRRRFAHRCSVSRSSSVNSIDIAAGPRGIHEAYQKPALI